MCFAVPQDALEVTHRLVDQVDDHFGRAHGVYGSALSDMALMMKSLGQHKEATNTYLKALEVCLEMPIRCPNLVGRCGLEVIASVRTLLYATSTNDYSRTVYI